jgi:hypothetical protein
MIAPADHRPTAAAEIAVDGDVAVDRDVPVSAAAHALAAAATATTATPASATTAAYAGATATTGRGGATATLTKGRREHHEARRDSCGDRDFLQHGLLSRTVMRNDKRVRTAR